MNFIVGPIPENPGFDPEREQWSGINEPDPIRLQLWAIPVVLTVGGVLVLLFLSVTPVRLTDVPLPLYIIVFPFLVPVHEIIHAVFHPRQGLSEKTFIGFWPKALLFYAHYEGELPRNRFILILAAPFVFLSLGPVLLSALWQSPHPLWAAVSITNGLSAAGDLLGIPLILFQIPGDALIKNKGWRSYWKRAA
jgi:hypothetical protein